MKKKLVKPLVLALVFIGALISFSIITNQTNVNLTSAMEEAKLPLVRFYHNGTAINELHGYVKEMDVAKMRDTITPIGSDRQLSLEVDTYGMTVDRLSYEIRGIDGERLVADGEITDYSYSENRLCADIKVQKNINLF